MSKQKVSITIHESYEVSLVLKKSTIKKLEKLGKMFSTYNDVVEELLTHCESCDKYWENKL